MEWSCMDGPLFSYLAERTIFTDALWKYYMMKDGYTAHVAYEIHEKGLDIRHTVVPEAIGGRGIASALVKAVYDYALVKRLKPIATCSYAVAWLQRHPEYGGEVSECYGGKGTCAL